MRLGATLGAVDGVVMCSAPFSGLALYVAQLSRDTATGPSPPPLEWSVRARFGGRSEEVASGTATWPDGWDTSGLLVQVAGRVVEGWELWARAVADGDVRLALRWGLAPASACGAPSVLVGAL